MTGSLQTDPARFEARLVERMVGIVLRGGVLAAAAVTSVGGAIFLARHAGDPVDFRVFHGEPETLKTLSGIVQGAAAFRGEWVIALGLLILIATPVARVAVLVVAFIRERDRLYVAVSALVLAVLLISALDGSV
jgi:uncharacterized membrane protein